MSMGIGSEAEGEARLLLPPQLNILGYFPIKWQGYLLFLKFWNSAEESDKMIPALEEFLMGTKLFAKEKKKKTMTSEKGLEYFTGQSEDINKVKPLF